MPPKNCELGAGQLFFMSPDGEKQIVAPVIPELKMGEFKEDSESPYILRSASYEAEIACKTSVNRKLFLKLVLGISNNWLKMHGYPMLRKRGRRNG